MDKIDENGQNGLKIGINCHLAKHTSRKGLRNQNRRNETKTEKLELKWIK